MHSPALAGRLERSDGWPASARAGALVRLLFHSSIREYECDAFPEKASWDLSFLDALTSNSLHNDRSSRGIQSEYFFWPAYLAILGARRPRLQLVFLGLEARSEIEIIDYKKGGRLIRVQGLMWEPMGAPLMIRESVLCLASVAPLIRIGNVAWNIALNTYDGASVASSTRSGTRGGISNYSIGS